MKTRDKLKMGDLIQIRRCMTDGRILDEFVCIFIRNEDLNGRGYCDVICLSGTKMRRVSVYDEYDRFLLLSDFETTVDV